LYDEKGKELDQINLDKVIRNYVERLSGYSGGSTEPGSELEVLEKDYELLELMYSRDMDIDTASELLGLSEEKINAMIQKLATIDLIQYSSHDTVELTDTGISYLKKKK